MEENETKLDQPLGGLLLMTIMTAIWTLLAEYYFKSSDYYLVGTFFAIVLIGFVVAYFYFNRRKKTLPKILGIKDPKKERMYWIIVALEGLAIFIVKNVLINIGRDEFFISCFALIVGLHFIPMAKVFERKFDYYIGFWTITAAVLGISLTFQQTLAQNLINALVCTACAVSTTLYGIKMIADAKKRIGYEIAA